ADYLKAKLRKDELLAPGFGMSELRTIFKRHRSKALMLVGHEPDFTNVISGLRGASLKLSKAGVALLDVDPESEEGKLLWLFPPNWRRNNRIIPGAFSFWTPNLRGRSRFVLQTPSAALRKSAARVLAHRDAIGYHACECA